MLLRRVRDFSFPGAISSGIAIIHHLIASERGGGAFPRPVRVRGIAKCRTCEVFAEVFRGLRDGEEMNRSLAERKAISPQVIKLIFPAFSFFLRSRERSGPEAEASRPGAESALSSTALSRLPSSHAETFPEL